MKKIEEIDDFEQNYGYEAVERASIYEYELGLTRKEAEERVLNEISVHQVLCKRLDG